MPSLEIPGPVVLWAPDRGRFLAMEELERGVDASGRVGAIGRIWTFAPDGAGSFVGQPYPTGARFGVDGAHVHPPRELPCWLGDGSGIVFETPDAVGHGGALERLDPRDGSITVFARAPRGRRMRLAGALPRGGAVAVYLEDPDAEEGDASSRRLALIDGPGAEPRPLSREGVLAACFSPTGERVAAVVDDAHAGYRLVVHALDAPTAEIAVERGVPVADLGLLTWSPDGVTLAAGVLEAEPGSTLRQGYLLIRAADGGAGLAVERFVDADAHRDLQLVAWHPDGERLLRSAGDRRAALARMFGSTDTASDDAASELALDPDAPWLTRLLTRLVTRVVLRRVERESAALVAHAAAAAAHAPSTVELVGGLDGERTLLSLEPSDAVGWIGCSPDGRFAAARVVRGDGASELLAVPLEGTDALAAAPLAVGRASPEAPEPAWFGDGATLCWATRGGEAWTLEWSALAGAGGS